MDRTFEAQRYRRREIVIRLVDRIAWDNPDAVSEAELTAFQGRVRDDVQAVWNVGARLENGDLLREAFRAGHRRDSFPDGWHWAEALFVAFQVKSGMATTGSKHVPGTEVVRATHNSGHVVELTLVNGRIEDLVIRPTKPGFHQEPAGGMAARPLGGSDRRKSRSGWSHDQTPAPKQRTRAPRIVRDHHGFRWVSASASAWYADGTPVPDEEVACVSVTVITRTTNNPEFR